MPEIAAQPVSSFIQVHNLRLHYLISQPQASGAKLPPKTMVFLHGFPEHSGVWEKQLTYFADNYTVIALDLPGYNLSQAPTSIKQFSVPHLVTIVAEFIKLLATDSPIILVAHDWGGALAWPLANRFPELLDKLIIINAAHPSTFTREMIENQNQRRLSDYIHDFLQANAEKVLTEDNFAVLKALTIGKCRQPLSAAKMIEYEGVWSRPNAITNMLNYYRAMPQLFPREKTINQAQQKGRNLITNPEIPLDSIKIPHIQISTPTLVLWGDDDQAFDIKVLDGLSAYIDDYSEHRFADASHWVHHEKPEAVNQAIERFVSDS